MPGAAGVLLAVLVAAAAVLGYATGPGGRVTTAQEISSPAPSAASASPSMSASPSVPASPTASPSPAPGAALEQAKRSTVLLVLPCPTETTDRAGCIWGSGSLIGDGLVLTNAHVAARAEPHLGVRYGYSQNSGPKSDPANAPYLIVWTYNDDDQAPIPSYRAHVVAKDGYLDLAVLRLDQTADGRPLAAPPQLASVPIGSVAKLATGSGLQVIGYPAISGSLALTVRGGRVSAYPEDPEGRAPARWEIDTDAEIDSGNSGGLAIDDDGRLIGVPSFTRASDGEKTRRIRSVDMAAPLIAAARAQQPYVSKYLQPSNGNEVLGSVSWAVFEPETCSAGGAGPVDAANSLHALLDPVGLTQGEDLKWVLTQEGQVLQAGYAVWEDDESCFKASYLGDVQPGTVTLTAYAGAPWRPIGTATVDVITPADSEEADE